MSCHATIRSLLATACVLSTVVSTAFGSTVLGNPTTGVVLGEGRDVYIHRVVAFRCSSGSQSASIEAVFDKDDQTTITFDPDEYCAVDVELKWTSSGPLVAVPVDGFTLLKLQAGAPSLDIVVDASAQTATLQ